MDGPIYLDNHATTRCDPRVVEAMLPWFTESYGNTGSTGHRFGHEASDTVDSSRAVIAASIGAQPEEIVFTSGATESNNLAINGVAARKRRRGDHVISVATEHRAVLDPLAKLARLGHPTTLLDVEPQGGANPGWLDPQRIADACRDDTCLASVMLANNEIGVIQPIAEIASACRDRGVLLHCDATQAVGKIEVDVNDLGVDLMSFTAHKMHGPKGIGALYVRGRDPIVRLEPQITGGGQQRGRRSGTLNVPGIVGFAEAIRLCQDELSTEQHRLAGLRNRLWEQLRSHTPGVELLGPDLDGEQNGRRTRLPGNLMVGFGDVDGEAIQMKTPDLAVSSGAACSSADPQPSHVLRAIGLSEDAARCSLRFGLGRFTSEGDVDRAARIVAHAVAELRAG